MSKIDSNERLTIERELSCVLNSFGPVCRDFAYVMTRLSRNDSPFPECAQNLSTGRYARAVYPASPRSEPLMAPATKEWLEDRPKHAVALADDRRQRRCPPHDPDRKYMVYHRNMAAKIL